ncbi:MAG: hypothetical protein V2I97_00380 [Desulfococcaceae bacterium]|jgi:hypothetical protein|nr:hypothetical protein [Desulfococcaceae bacterium]
MKKGLSVKKMNIFLLIFCIIAWGVIAGCGSDDDDSIITVCNWDNDEYTVQLHRASDDTVVDSFHLEEWYDFGGDQCDEFKDYTGEYYLTIYEDNAEYPSDISSYFYVEDEEYEDFYIDESGEIKRN